MGASGSMSRSNSDLISPRATALRKGQNQQLTLDSPALIDLHHGTIRYRLPDEKRKQENAPEGQQAKVKTGYFYHPHLDDFSEDAEIPADDRFKFYYVFKGAKKDGRNKRLYYVYGTSMKSNDEGIKQEPYKPKGKGYNWPESYRKANNLYYELVFADQDDEEFSETDTDLMGSDDTSETTETVVEENIKPIKDNLRLVLTDSEVVESLKKRLALRLLIPSANFHILYNKQELRNDDMIGDLRTPEQGSWRKFAITLHLT